MSEDLEKLTEAPAGTELKERPADSLLNLLPDESSFMFIPNWIVDELLPRLDAAEQSVYMQLYRLTWGNNSEVCLTSLGGLAERTGMSLNPVRQATRRLEEKGLIANLGPFSFGQHERGLVFQVFRPDGPDEQEDMKQSEQTRYENTLPSRVGKVRIQARIATQKAEQLDLLAFMLGKTKEELIEEGIAYVLNKYQADLDAPKPPTINKIFIGKSKQLYDFLYSQTRGAIIPSRIVRMTRPQLMRAAGIGAKNTLDFNLGHLTAIGLIKVSVMNGEHSGNQYEVFLPEEIGLTLPTKIFIGKSKQLYDVLYARTRGAARKQIRIPMSELQLAAGYGSRVTLLSHIKHFESIGLFKVLHLVGEQEGNLYEVYLPEEVGLGTE